MNADQRLVFSDPFDPSDPWPAFDLWLVMPMRGQKERYCSCTTMCVDGAT